MRFGWSIKLVDGHAHFLVVTESCAGDKTIFR